MEVAYSAKALEDISYWKKTGNKKIQARIAGLIEDTKRHPFSGIGKPEPLKYELAGKWSRRIDKENRIEFMQLSNNAGDQVALILLNTLHSFVKFFLCPEVRVVP